MTMPHRFLNEHPDVLQVLLAHIGAIAISFLDVELALKISSLVLAIGYTCWKWHTEWKKSKDK
jgi:hypothetical protein